MLGKLFKALRGKSASDIDGSLGYTRLPEFKGWLAQQNYEAFESAYETLTWDARSLVNEGIGLDATQASAIKHWLSQRPESYAAHLFAGVSETALAWIARTSGVANSVSGDRAQQFFEHLEAADEHLQRADELNQNDAEICARTIRVYMGLQTETEAAASYFEAAKQLVPNHLIAHLMMINFLNPKWGGSLDQMKQFAQDMYTPRSGSILVTLPLFSLVEEWLHYDMNEEPKKHAQFFRDPSTRSYIKELYQNYREEEEGKLLIPYVYNYFAFLLHMINETELAKEAGRKIPGKMTVYPWAYIGVESNKEMLHTLKL